MLSCSVIAVRGIASQVDIVWSSDDSELETVAADVTSITNNSVEYTGYYSIEQLNETDDGRVLQCTVVIDASPPVMADDNITLHTTSKNSYIVCVYLCIPCYIPDALCVIYLFCKAAMYILPMWIYIKNH